MEDHAPRTAEEIAAFRRRVDKSPNARTFLVSNDGTATLINATFIEKRLDYGKAFSFVQNLVVKSRDAHHDVYMAGQAPPPGRGDHAQSQMFRNFFLTLPATARPPPL